MGGAFVGALLGKRPHTPAKPFEKGEGAPPGCARNVPAATAGMCGVFLGGAAGMCGICSAGATAGMCGVCSAGATIGMCGVCSAAATAGMCGVCSAGLPPGCAVYVPRGRPLVAPFSFPAAVAGRSVCAPKSARQPISRTARCPATISIARGAGLYWSTPSRICRKRSGGCPQNP